MPENSFLHRLAARLRRLFRNKKGEDYPAWEHFLGYSENAARKKVAEKYGKKKAAERRK